MTEQERRKALSEGENRFFFGFAEPGEVQGQREFIGNYRLKRDAVEASHQHGGMVVPYINGRLRRGWVVWRTIIQ